MWAQEVWRWMAAAAAGADLRGEQEPLAGVVDSKAEVHETSRRRAGDDTTAVAGLPEFGGALVVGEGLAVHADALPTDAEECSGATPLIGLEREGERSEASGVPASPCSIEVMRPASGGRGTWGPWG